MKIKDFSQSYSALSKFALGLMILLLLSNMIWAFYAVNLAKRPPQWSFIATELGTLKARLSPEADREIPEMISHVRTFCHKMYSHHEKNYTKQLNAALELIAAGPGQRIVLDFERAGLYPSYIELNGRTEFVEDTIRVDPVSKKGVIYGRVVTTAWVPDERKVESPLAAEFELSIWHRSDKNPHGLLINSWEKIPYNP